MKKKVFIGLAIALFTTVTIYQVKANTGIGGLGDICLLQNGDADCALGLVCSPASTGSYYYGRCSLWY